MTETADPPVRWQLRYKVLRGHVHCRVFTAPRGLAWAKAGDLVFGLAEWPHVADVLRSAGLEPEEERTRPRRKDHEA